MENERISLVRELCYIAETRNEINKRRHQAKWRKSYYLNAIKVVEAHNKSNSQLRMLLSKLEAKELHSVEDVHEIARLQSSISKIELDMAALVLKHPNPKKWKEMGLIKLRSLALKAQGDYAFTKHETMEFSLKTTARVRELTKLLNCHTLGDNGAIVSIIHNTDSEKTILYVDIQLYAKEYQLNLAVSEMLQE